MFDWKLHDKAEKWLYTHINTFKEKNKEIVTLEKELLEITSTKLFDWIDHIVLEENAIVEEELLSFGFEQESAHPEYRVFTHMGAKLPSVLLCQNPSKHESGIVLKVESIADFFMVRGKEGVAVGAPFSHLRIARVSPGLSVVERRGSRIMEPDHISIPGYHEYSELWRMRKRDLHDEEEGMKRALILAEEMAEQVGKDVAAHIIMEGERAYWQVRNRAATVQKNRQDKLGLGWANHDHHTFRSSRSLFQQLVRLFEIVGFQCRERYYAGEQAGWGAQIMENHQAGLVLFLDVDVGPDDLHLDFAHHKLHEREKLATVGLWCALHGDSILHSGMHHLEAQFNFDKLRDDLKTTGIGMMEPFSNFPYLRQAFTQAEMWKVAPERVEKLLKKGQITPTHAEQFLSQGAVGSHLENLERHEGYKGFNKDSVNRIIQKTDPRLLHS